MRNLLVAAVLLAGTAAVRAQGIDLSSGGPVNVTAAGGFEWREAQQEVVATGDARAVRGTVTVLADTLIAHYRKKAPAPGAPPPAATAVPGTPGGPDSGADEVYRLEADGHVRIVTPTDESLSDHAIYDIDQSVLLLTGHAMKLTTPQDVLTAKDSMEYWSQKHMAVGRGHALVVTSDGRRLSADTLVAYTTAPAATPGAAKPAAPVAQASAAPGGKPSADPLASSGKLQRVEAYGNIEIRTVADTVFGDRGVYLPDTGLARVVGHVRITHGQNQLNGPAADVNMKTGVAHIISDPASRVQGLIMPNDTGAAASPGAKPGSAKPGPAKKAPTP